MIAWGMQDEIITFPVGHGRTTGALFFERGGRVRMLFLQTIDGWHPQFNARHFEETGFDVAIAPQVFREDFEQAESALVGSGNWEDEDGYYDR